MRNVNFFLAGLTMLLVPLSCTETIGEASMEEKGEVTIILSSEARLQPVGKAVAEEVPLGDFKVELFKLDGQSEVRLYRDTYSNTEGKTIGLNTGDYRLYAHYGDPDAAGFDAPYYAAEKMFSVSPQTIEEVDAVAKLSNVMVTVEFGETLRMDYPDFHAIVRSGEDASLKFVKDETRKGYVPAGMISLELYANVDGTWKYFPSEPQEYSPNDYVAFYVDTEPATGEVSLKISIDNSVDLIEEEVSIPACMLPQDAPKLTFNGFGGDDAVGIVEGQEVTQAMKVDMVAGAGIAHCILEIDSEYLSALGVPPEVDLVSADESVAEILKANGFSWAGLSSGQRLAFMDFTGVAEKLASEVYDDENPFSATVRFTLEDMAGKRTVSGERGFTISAVRPEFSFSVQPTDAWARSIRGMEIGYTVGNPDVLKLQYRASSENEWKDAGLSSDSGAMLSFNNITGLSPETEYHLRAIYNGNETTAIYTALTTEAAAQVGNSGFEEWQIEQVLVYSTIFGGSKTYQNNYQPWSANGERWWGMNNNESIITGLTLVASNLNYRTFPVVSYVKGRTTDKAAQIIAACIGDFNTSGTTAAGTRKTVAGRLYTNDGNVDGHAFGSRPDKLGFWYKYLPRTDSSHSTDTFRATVQLSNGDTVIGTGTFEYTASSEVTDWVYAEAEVSYSNMDLPATSIYVEFRQSTNSDPVYNIDCPVPTYDGSTNAHAGSILTVDDLQLIYE